MFGRNKVKKVANRTSNYHLAVDIGTEFVKSAVFKVVDGEVVVLGYSRIKQKDSAMYAAFIINLQSVIESCDRGIGEAVSQAMEKEGESFTVPTDVIIGIAGELVHGVTIMVNVEREDSSTKINQKEIDKFVEKVKKYTFSSTVDEISKEMGLKASQVIEVNTTINSVYIDGVKIMNPLGYSGNELIYKVFSTFAPKIHLDSINQVASALNLTLSKIVVEPYSLAVGLRNMKDPDANAIIIDVGGGTTDVAVISNGDIVGTKMFAIGGKVFTKRVQRELGVDYEEAEKIKIDYANGAADKDVDQKLSKAFEIDISTWLTGVEIALESFTDVKEYPTQIYICGGGALLPEIQEGLMTYPWLQTLNFKKFPKVSFIFPNAISNVIDKTKSATLPMDVTPLALARMHLDNL
jgi:cell division protein FtsA